MKILHSIPHVLRTSAGPSYSVLRLCDYLSINNEISLISSDEVSEKFRHDFIKTFPSNLGLKKLGVSLKMQKWIANNLKNQKFDIVHSHSLWMMQNIYPSWESKKNGIPIVISPRGTLSKEAFKSGSITKRLFWPLIQKPVLRDSTIFHATSTQEKNDIRELGFKQPIAVVPNGIDLPEIKEIKKDNKTFKKLLFLGRIHPIKGIDNLLMAWKEVQNIHQDWILEIVGPNNYNYLSELHRIIKNLQLKRVIFSEEIHGEEKNKKYQSADLFILPSHSENFGVSVAEALSNGIPCIVSKGAPWKMLDEKKAGWWIGNSVEMLTKKLISILSTSNSELESMGLNGRNLVTEDFNWNKVSAMMTEVYSWILTRENKPSFIHHD